MQKVVTNIVPEMQRVVTNKKSKTHSWIVYDAFHRITSRHIVLKKIDSCGFLHFR